MRWPHCSLQVVPTEWKPSKEEMKKAEVMDPNNEPQGIMEVCQPRIPLPSSGKAQHHARLISHCCIAQLCSQVACHAHDQGTSARLIHAEKSLPMLQAWHHNRRQACSVHGIARNMLRLACIYSLLLLSVALDTFLRCRCGATNGARCSACMALHGTFSGWGASSCGCCCA